MPNLTVNGRRVDYSEFHLRTGPLPIMLLAEDREWWTPVGKLMPWDYYVISLAWSGDVELTATDGLGLAQAMGMPWTHMAGYGAGGRAALLAAIKSPQVVRSLTLIAPFEGAMSPENALPWDRLQGLETPTLILEPEGASAEAQRAVDRLLDTLPNSQPEFLRDWRAKLNDDMARRLGVAIVHQIETAYDGLTPVGVNILRG